jgi:RHS repeat-associated protein
LNTCFGAGREPGKTLKNCVNWYDYGSRFYSADIARFSTIDPLSEKYSFQSLYAYATNNPIRFIDWMGMGPGDPPVGTTQFYLKFKGSFGPQIGFSIGDIIKGSVSGANVVGETKIGITITPEGKTKFLFDQQSKNVNYELKGTVPVLGGKSISSEYGTKEHPSMAAEKTETQKGFTKETTTESDENVKTVESTGYEVGLGVNAVLLGIEANIGFESIDNSETEDKQPVEIPEPERKEDELK